MKSTTELFNVVGNHDLRELLFARLDYKDAIRLFSISKQYQQLLTTDSGKKSLDNIITRALLTAVVNADWQLAQKIAHARPELMFKKVTGVDLDGSTLNISPLEYACRACDEHMIMIFRHAVNEKDWHTFYYIVNFYFSQRQYLRPEHKFSIELDSWLKNNITTDELRALICKQNTELQARSRIFDDGILKNIYEEYIYLLMHRDVFAKEKIDEYWQSIVGYAQRYLVPRHMLKQMCAYDAMQPLHHEWFDHSDFNNAMPLKFNAKGTVFSSNIDDIIHSQNRGELGKDFALAYSHGDLHAEPSSKMYLPIGDYDLPVWLNPIEDYKVYSHLTWQRKQHINELLKDLEYEFGIKTDPDTKFYYDKRHEKFEPASAADHQSKCTIL